MTHPDRLFCFRDMLRLLVALLLIFYASSQLLAVLGTGTVLRAHLQGNENLNSAVFGGCSIDAVRHPNSSAKCA